MCYDGYQKKNRGREGRDDEGKTGKEVKLDGIEDGNGKDVGDGDYTEEKGDGETRIFNRSRIVSDIQMVSRDSMQKSSVHQLRHHSSINNNTESTGVINPLTSINI